MKRLKHFCKICGKDFFFPNVRGRKCCSIICSKKAIILGNKKRKGIEKPNQSGNKSANWKGNNVGMGALHEWVIKNLGQPTVCEYCKKTGLTSHNIHWANKSHEYKRDLNDWLRLCVSCHHKYDKSASPVFIYSRKGTKNGQKQKEAARIAQLQRWNNIFI
jgi:hypothetical protein